MIRWYVFSPLIALDVFVVLGSCSAWSASAKSPEDGFSFVYMLQVHYMTDEQGMCNLCFLGPSICLVSCHSNTKAEWFGVLELARRFFSMDTDW